MRGLALATVATLGVPAALAAPTGDPLRGTVAALPAALVALALLERRAVRAGGRRLPPSVAAALGGGLLVWLAAAAARPLLDLPYLDPVLAAAAFALVAVAALAIAPRWRALLPVAGPPSWLFFALPLVVYLAVLPWQLAVREPDGDEPWYLLLAHSLVHDGDVDLANDYAAESSRAFMSRALEPQPGDPRGAGGEAYSRHNFLLPLLLAPGYLAAGRFGATATMAAAAALLAWLVLALAPRYRLPPAAAWCAWAVTAFTPPLLVYAGQIWVEVPAAVLVAWALLEMRRAGGARAWLIAPLVLLPVLKLRLGILSVALLALALFGRGLRRRAGAIAAGAAALLLAILAANALLFGNPLKIYRVTELLRLEPGAGALARGLLGPFLDLGFGLFAMAPLWALLLPGLVLLARRRSPLLRDLAGVALPYLLVVASRREWYGGWSPPFRYGVPLLALLALTVGALAVDRHRGGARALVAALGAVTAVLAALWVVVPGWTFNFADGGSYPLDLLAARLDADVARFFPSYVRPGLASWLWPPVLAAVVTVLWWRPRGGRRSLRRLAVPAAMVLAVAPVWFASRVPTRVVQFEDPWVEPAGGSVFPSLWTIERVRFRGAWGLPEGRTIAAPVVPGGGRLVVEVDARLLRDVGRPGRLVLRAGSHVLDRRELPFDSSWRTLRFGPVDWPPGEPLVIALAGGRPPGGERQVVLLDRAELAWR